MVAGFPLPAPPPEYRGREKRRPPPGRGRPESGNELLSICLIRHRLSLPYFSPSPMFPIPTPKSNAPCWKSPTASKSICLRPIRCWPSRFKSRSMPTADYGSPSSETYPQVKPGQQADDKILVLEDADGDGRADKTTIFARGLLIPSGIEPGDGGVYVANSTDLILI